MTRPRFQRPSALSVRVLGFRARASYAVGCIWSAPLGVKYAKYSEVEQRLHSGKTGAEDSSVRFENRPDAEPDEIICGGDFSYTMVGKSQGSRTGKIVRISMDGHSIQTKCSRDDDAGRCSLAN